MTTIPSRLQPATHSAPAFVFPVTEGQSRCWFLDQLTPGNTALNVAVRWELRGNVRDDTVEAAFAAIVARHEVLRTRIVERDGAPVQEVMPAADSKLVVVDLRTMPQAAHDGRVEAIARESAAEPFDLARPPLIRVTLVRLATERALLHIVAHQSVFDGFSIRVLGHEFGALAEAIEAGSEPALPDLPLQYGDFALWQRDYLASAAIERDIAYWRAQFCDAGYFEVEPDLPRPPERGTAGASVHADLPGAFGERLEAEARRFDTTSFVYCTAVLSAVLHRLTGSEDILIGTQVAGRTEVDLEALIGIFINNLVLRVPVRPDTVFADHVRAARRVVQEALIHQNMPFNRLVEALNPRRDRSRNPLISVNFDLQRTTFFENRTYRGFELISRPSHAPGAIYDLNFLLIGRPDSWRLTLEYSTDLFLRETAQAILDQFVSTLAFALDHPQAPVSALPEPHRRVGAAGSPGSTVAHEAEAPAEPIGPVRASVGDALGIPVGFQERLGRIWGEILDREVDGAAGDFFELGGHSLLVVRMLARVRAEFGVSFGLGAFLADPTLLGCARGLAVALARAEAEEAADATWELITLEKGDPDGPVILTINHPVLYYGLKGGLGQGATLANLRIPNRASVAAQAEMDLDAITEEAARQVRAAFPRRTIVPVGLCVNGRVAMRLAQLLHEAGERVGLLAMIDTWAPGTFKSLSPLAPLRHALSLRTWRYAHYARQGIRGELGLLGLLTKVGPVSRLLRALRVVEPLSEDESLVVEVTDHLVAKARHYAFAPYDGDTLLFRTDASLPLAGETMFGWDGLVPEDTPVYPVSGWHEDALLAAGMQRLARILRLRLGLRDASHGAR
jgi:thioesterase domain-containing protein